MTAAAASDAAMSDADLAFALFLHAPVSLGGLILRGDGPVREAMCTHARNVLAGQRPLLRLPATIDADRLHGGLDLAATLAAGRPIEQPGLVGSAAGGVIIVPMADRVREDVAAALAEALDGGRLALLMLDDGASPEEAPPVLLSERTAFRCDVAAQRAFGAPDWPDAISLEAVAPLVSHQREALAATAAALGIASVRPLLYAQTAALTHAALNGRAVADDEDILAAVRLVLAPRATQLPTSASPETEPEPSPAPEADRDGDDDGQPFQEHALDDMLLDAAAAAIPPHLLDQIAAGLARGGKGTGGRGGQKQRSARRGRPLGSRAGVPGSGKRLALVDTLRAAAPWQTIRRQAASAGDRRDIRIAKSDLRVRTFEQRSESLTIFAVDASGSSAMARLAEAKGAVELLLAEAYVKRSQVALIAFRQAGAELLLPPTRSLTRACRALAALPGGGGTPLAAGLIAAQQLADAATRRGQTPMIAVLTDGKANVALDGSANREAAMHEAGSVAQALAATRTHSIVIDISPRPRAEAAALAAAMGGRYLPLPHAGSAAMVAAIESL